MSGVPILAHAHLVPDRLQPGEGPRDKDGGPAIHQVFLRRKQAKDPR